MSRFLHRLFDGELPPSLPGRLQEAFLSELQVGGLRQPQRHTAADPEEQGADCLEEDEEEEEGYLELRNRSARKVVTRRPLRPP